MSENEEFDPSGENRPAQDEPGAFDAFRAWRAQEQAGNEPTAEAFEPGAYDSGPFEAAQYESGPYEPGPYASGQYEPGLYESEPTAMLPPGLLPPGMLPPDMAYAQPVPTTPDGGRERGRLRSIAVLAGAAVLVAGVVFGVYEATKPSSGQPAAASPAVTASRSPSAGASKGAKNGRATLARLTVTSVGADSFTATTADGRTVSVQIKPTTKFGTAARPFARSQLVPGAVVYARLRHEADGSVVATVIASATAGKGSAAPPASSSATADAGA